MYKIYINEQLLILSKKPVAKSSTENLVKVYTGMSGNLLNIIHKLEQSFLNYSYINIYSDNLNLLWADFCALCKIIPAAGGIVENKKGEILAIFRRGHWDLPKGKIEQGEYIEETAVREVEEETGIAVDRLRDKLQVSYHTYRTKSNKLVLKPSHWYLMYSKSKKLKPQKEEDIEQAIWVDPKELANTKEPIYKTIQVLLSEHYL